MARFCPRCGKEIPEAGRFCPFCAANVEDPSSWQGAGGSQGYTPGGMSRKMKAVILSIVVVIAVVVSVVMVLFMFGDELSEGTFVGTWDAEMVGYNTTGSWVFHEDGRLELISYYFDENNPDDYPNIYFESDAVMNTLTVSDLDLYSVSNGTWEIKDGELCIHPSNSSSGPSYCFDYEKDGDTITLSGMYTVTLTKASGGSSGMNVEWKDINISVSPGHAGEIEYSWIKLTRKLDVPYSGGHAPATWGYVKEGDVIQIADQYTSVSITGEFTWVPNGQTIDWFTV